MLYVTTYTTAGPDSMDKIMAVYPRHRAYLDEFAKGGEIWLIGSFPDFGTPGSMAVFRSAEAADRFVAGDPFVREGLAVPSAVREWNALVFDA